MKPLKHLGLVFWSIVALSSYGQETPLSGESLYQLRSSWTRQDGKTVDLKTLRGTYVAAAMIYTNCKGACPLVVADLQKIERAVPDRYKSRVRFALFSLDPAHDSPTRLKSYAVAHDLDLTKWSLYRANDRAVRELAAALDLKYKKDSAGNFDHSNLITLLDPEGRIVKQLAGIKQDPALLISAIQ